MCRVVDRVVSVGRTIGDSAEGIEECEQGQGRPPLGKLGAAFGEQVEGVLDAPVLQQHRPRTVTLCERVRELSFPCRVMSFRVVYHPW